jgi:hypothetical protein
MANITNFQSPSRRRFCGAAAATVAAGSIFQEGLHKRLEPCLNRRSRRTVTRPVFVRFSCECSAIGTDRIAKAQAHQSDKVV